VSESAVRARIKAIVAAVEDVGQVHDYERWSAEWDAFLGHFQKTIEGTDYIRGWTISCSAVMQERMDWDQNRRTYRYVIRGYWGLDDSVATEKTALAKAISVVEALDASTALHESAGTYEATLASIERFEPRLFGGTLCHYAEITLAVTEMVDA